MKKMISKIMNISEKINEFNRKYEITIISASTSFYIIVALFSLAILSFQMIVYFSDTFEDLILSKVFDIINPIYQSLFADIKPEFVFNTFAAFITVNFIWSASKIINSLNNIADRVYVEVERRKGYLKRASAFLMFLMLMLIVFFQIAFLVYTNYIIDNVFNNMIVLRVAQFFIEVIMLFFTISIVYIYVPPLKTRFRDVLAGSTIATAGIYTAIAVFILIFEVYQEFNITYSILTVISLSFLLIYGINILLILGIHINYRLKKYGSIFHH